MEKPQLNFHEYLRYFFAGGIAVGAFLYFYYGECQLRELFQTGGIKDSVLFSLISLIIGSLIYAVHRAIIFPIFTKISLLILYAYGTRKLSTKRRPPWLFFKRKEEKGKYDWLFEYSKGLWWPFGASKVESSLDFRRWYQRNYGKTEITDKEGKTEKTEMTEITIPSVRTEKTETTIPTEKTKKEELQSFAKNLVEWGTLIHFLYCSTWAFLLALVLTNNFLKYWWIILILLIIPCVSHFRGNVYDLKIKHYDRLYYHNDLPKDSDNNY